jgi:hypothetical protein
MPETLSPAPREPKNPKQQHLLELEKQVEQFKKREEQEKAVKTKLTEMFNEAPALAKTLQETHAAYLRHPDRTDLLYSLCVQALSVLKIATEKTECEKTLAPNATENHLRKRLLEYHKTIYGFDETITLPLTKKTIVTHYKGFADYYLDYEKALARNKTLAACRAQHDALTEYAIKNASALNELSLYCFGKTAVFKYNATTKLETQINQPNETTG